MVSLKEPHNRVGQKKLPERSHVTLGQVLTGNGQCLSKGQDPAQLPVAKHDLEPRHDRVQISKI